MPTYLLIANLLIANLAEIVRASSGLLLSLGMLVALGVLGWVNWIAPFYRTLPPKPTFANENGTAPPPKPIIEPPKLEKPKPKPVEKPDVLYKATVNSSIGLVLRQKPEPGSGAAGGAAFKAEVEIIKESDDREWAMVRDPATQEQGWVRVGNLTRS
ncbi:MAG: SH3 domain-containing protein [Pseudanabaenaceae cyanobacterium bins.68]|nr:SH3 domain-containing protein [Pseudanabaenaceae cyanobacterium bins.68]